MTKQELIEKASQVAREWAEAEVLSSQSPLRLQMTVLIAGIAKPDYYLDVRRIRESLHEHEQF